MTDVLVVGGGIIGLSAGWHLARHGARVTVVEAGEPLRFTSRAAAAMIAPVGYLEPADDQFLRLRTDAHADWDRFAASLLDDTGVDPAYQRIGSLVAAFDDAGLARADALRTLHAQLGIDSSVVDAATAHELEPLVRGMIGGLWVPGEGCVDPDAAGRALLRGIRSRQGTVRTGVPVSRLRSDGDRIVGVTLSDGTDLDAALVLVAAGAASTGLGGIPETARFPLRAVKGQSLLVRDRTEAPTVRTVLRAGANLVPRGDGRLMIAGTVEDAAGLGDHNTVAGMYEVLDRAVAAVPAVRELPLDGWCVGQRPVAADDAPVLGPSGTDGLWWATGHSYYGILLSGLTGRLLADAVYGDRAAADRLRLFAAERFRTGTPKYASLTHDRHA
ncbi:glycine oxidase ThiO [Actinocatenispora thailandica]|uniref:Glycine oxidase ThiO n=1 Tax=Actinocatenispora thailandica TaxID=227318 RepID=A0A7R7DT20_9ACTN|nr:FAD-dependent oxidoreductase [Actinocatenispora thailandica]BCJ37287.1 glycine oxidase ThiO [Actinocatenispora thailandica]